MENWNAIGSAMRRCSHAKFQSKRQSCRFNWNWLYLRRANRRHQTPEASWEITVAHAAPATPIPNHRMKIKSSAIFRIDAMIRKISGVRLSPSARMMPEIRL